MLSIYRLTTPRRRAMMGGFEYAYVKEKLTMFRFCPIQNRFIIIGFRWAGESPFGFSSKEYARYWGYFSLCKQYEEFILIGKIPKNPKG